MDIQDYDLVTLITNPSFRNWVDQTNSQDIAYWEDWKQQSPQNESLAQHAKEMYLAFKPYQKELPADEIRQKLQQLLPLLDQTAVATHAAPAKKAFPKIKLLAYATLAAAVVSLVVMAGILLFPPSKVSEISFTALEKQSHVLPDSSVVVLNKGAHLHYEQHWGPEQPRQLWIEGEAFFDIRQKPAQMHPQFIVHTNRLKVQVLGTTFTVKSRKDLTEVILNSGKITLNLAEQTDSLEMVPGDRVKVFDTGQAVQKDQVDAKLYLSWVDNKIILDETPVREIANWISDQYNRKVIVKDQALFAETLTGRVYAEDLDFLLEVLSKSFDLHIYSQSDTIFIE